MGHPPPRRAAWSNSFNFGVAYPNIIIDQQPNFVSLYLNRIARVIQ